ncbi:hypothetical protein GFS24_18160 [Chitinophaga sp. SYP-B3965]|uniref:hypothetical protein n=1 Tax=Chitinophaga sp. SYP-B3965 TaxID=2663120 RepID=UPI001299A4E8|nr:hypothetical protein [Chitinophaga sp. SYP-B3965]MRG47053.1 hypothetical protein [Chitinophaga sp. SYP-B3965]
MKKTMLGLTAITLFFAACKKDDASPETYYLSHIIEVGTDGNDTTFITYNADNTFKELSYSYINNDILESYAQGPVYEGGKIVSIYEKNPDQPALHTISSFVYTAGVVSKVQYFGDRNGDGIEDTYRYDSLVYAGGKLAELFEMNNGYNKKSVLTWEGNNVKVCSLYVKEGGADYVLNSVKKYTYDNKPGFQQLLGNYQWLSDVASVEYLSANNVVKEEMFMNGELYSTFTDVYTFEGNLLKTIDSEDTFESGSPDIYKVKLEYITR